MEYYLLTGNSRLDLLMNTIRLKHPIFQSISITAFKYLIENSFLFKINNDQHVYKDNFKAVNNIYFILYGDIRFEKEEVGSVGETLGIGQTVGEEVLFDDREVVHRMENSLSIGNSCLL